MTPSSNDTRRPIHYLHALREHWKIAVATFVLVVGAALAFLQVTPKTYEATADVVVTPVSAGDDLLRGFSVFQQSFDGSSAVVTAARTFGTAAVEVRAFEGLRGEAAAAEIVIQPLSQASIVSITARAHTAPAAVLAANAYARTAVASRTELFQSELQERIRRLRAQLELSGTDRTLEQAELQTRLGSLRSFLGAGDPTVRLLTAATPPDGPASPRPLLTLAAAVLAGTLLGIALAVIREFWNPRVSREDEITEEHQLPVLVRLPRLSGKEVAAVLEQRAAVPAWGKEYRTLRSILAASGARGTFPRSILITSASPGDGKSFTSLNLAFHLAAGGQLRVVLVDADFYRPSLARAVGVIPRRNGFIELLEGKAGPEEVLSPVPNQRGVKLLATRPDSYGSIHLLESRRVAEAIRRLEQVADVVVIDSPPTPEVAEVVEIAAAVETVIVAARLGHTRRDKLVALRDALARRGVTPLGVVLTTRTPPAGAVGGYYEQVAPIRRDPRPTRRANPEDEMPAAGVSSVAPTPRRKP